MGLSFCKHLGERLVATVAVIGGTHGNERLGVELYKQWHMNAAEELRRDTFRTEVVLGNPTAVVSGICGLFS